MWLFTVANDHPLPLTESFYNECQNVKLARDWCVFGSVEGRASARHGHHDGRLKTTKSQITT